MPKPKKFFASFPNPVTGAPFVAFELEAMLQWTDGGTTVTEPYDGDPLAEGQQVIYSLFGKYGPKHAKKGRECIGDFGDLSGALETMQDMGIISRDQRIRYDTKEMTRELFPE